jgi:hypothetical protein
MGSAISSHRSLTGRPPEIYNFDMTNELLLTRRLELLGTLKDDRHSLTLSLYDRNSGEWELEKALVYHLVDSC